MGDDEVLENIDSKTQFKKKIDNDDNLDLMTQNIGKMIGQFYKNKNFSDAINKMTNEIKGKVDMKNMVGELYKNKNFIDSVTKFNDELNDKKKIDKLHQIINSPQFDKLTEGEKINDLVETFTTDTFSNIVNSVVPLVMNNFIINEENKDVKSEKSKDSETLEAYLKPKWKKTSQKKKATSKKKKAKPENKSEPFDKFDLD
jgi:hypothetical protein